MSVDESANSLGPKVLTMRVVTFAMIWGVAMYLGYVLSQGVLRQPIQGNRLAPLGIVSAAIALAAQFLTPVLIRTPRQAGVDSEQFLSIFFTRHIINLALLEGSAFFNTLALMNEHHWWSLAIVVVLLLAMLVQWPTRTRLEQFLETARMEASL